MLQVGEQFALLKCEGHIDPRNVAMEEVRSSLEEQIREEKLRGVASGLFEKLQNSATVKNVYNDPQLSKAMPGVVATVNGEQITMTELGGECLARHGEIVLEGEISRTLLQQELKRASVTVSQADLEAEMAHAADARGVTNAAGQADLKRWIAMNTTEQDLAYEVYLRDSVWPSAALKKLTSGKVDVTDEDMKKGFEANYGPRVRCRAIVLASMRRAQEVWPRPARTRRSTTSATWRPSTRSSQRARRSAARCHRSASSAGSPNSRRRRSPCKTARCPAWCKWVTSLSSLRCEGRTEPEITDMNAVREILTADLYEKKLRLAMSETSSRCRSVPASTTT